MDILNKLVFRQSRDGLCEACIFFLISWEVLLWIVQFLPSILSKQIQYFWFGSLKWVDANKSRSTASRSCKINISVIFEGKEVFKILLENKFYLRQSGKLKILWEDNRNIKLISYGIIQNLLNDVRFLMKKYMLNIELDENEAVECISFDVWFK